mgnify:CR=1 FL=1
MFTPQPDLGWTTRHSQAEFVLRYGHVSGTDESGEPNEYYFTSGDINRFGGDKDGAKLNLKLEGFTDAKHFDPNGMIALYDKETGELASGWSYLKLLEHWQRKHNRAAYVPISRKGKATVLPWNSVRSLRSASLLASACSSRHSRMARPSTIQASKSHSRTVSGVSPAQPVPHQPQRHRGHIPKVREVDLRAPEAE